MSDIKLLNLDELAIVKRVVQFGGNNYEVAEQTIGQMISRMQATKDEDINDPVVFLANMRKTAQDILPTMPKKVLDTLSLDHIVRIVEFLNDKELKDAAESMAAEAQKAEAPANEKGKPEKK